MSRASSNRKKVHYLRPAFLLFVENAGAKVVKMLESKSGHLT